MTTIRQIITDSLREAGIIEAGEDPEANEFEEALRRINVLIRGFFGNELGERLENVNFGSAGLTNFYGVIADDSDVIESKYIPLNVRLHLNIDGPYSLFLSPTPADGARLGVIDNGDNLSINNVTISGNGRQIESADSLMLNTNGLNREWFYRADLGDWVRVTDLTADDVSPFPIEFDDLLTTLLAIRLNPRYGATTSDEMADTMKRMKKMFRSRYRQSVEVSSERGLLLLPSSYWWRNRGTFNA